MKRFIQMGTVASVGLVLLQVSADARFLDSKKQEQRSSTIVIPDPSSKKQPVASNPVYRSEVKSEKISLQFEDLSLLDVLRNIQDETGILFSIDPSLEMVPFSSSIQADNWEDAIKKLLKGFSRVEVWTDNLETSRVWLLSGSGVTAQEATDASIHLQKRVVSTPTSVSSRQPKARVLKAQRTASTNNKGFSQLPAHIQNDPEVLRYLLSKGAVLPQTITSKYGANLELLPPQRAMYPHVKNNQKFRRYLISSGFPLPTG